MKTLRLLVLALCAFNLNLFSAKQTPIKPNNFFIEFINEIADWKQNSEMVLENLRGLLPRSASLKTATARDFTIQIERLASVFIEENRDNYEALFDTNTASRIKKIGVEKLFSRINKVCQCEKIKFIKDLQRLKETQELATELYKKIEAFGIIDLTLRAKSNIIDQKKYISFIAKIRLLSIIKYGLYPNAQRYIMFNNLFTVGIEILGIFNTCKSRDEFNLIIERANEQVVKINFLD